MMVLMKCWIFLFYWLDPLQQNKQHKTKPHNLSKLLQAMYRMWCSKENRGQETTRTISLWNKLNTNIILQCWGWSSIGLRSAALKWPHHQSEIFTMTSGTFTVLFTCGISEKLLHFLFHICHEVIWTLHRMRRNHWTVLSAVSTYSHWKQHVEACFSEV